MRLRSLGYENVSDYVGGKADWLASGGALEGVGDHSNGVGAHVDRNTTTVDLKTPIDLVRTALESSPIVLTTTDNGVVLGRIEARDLTDAAEHETAEDVMRPGPTTIRADEDLAALNARMDRKNVDHIVVTRPDGVLIGVYHRNNRSV